MEQLKITNSKECKSVYLKGETTSQNDLSSRQTLADVNTAFKKNKIKF